MLTIKDKRFRLLLTEERIKDAVSGIAQRINKELAGDFPLFLAVLNGSFMFASDLLRQVTIPCEVSFIRVQSYSGTSSTGDVKEVLGLDADIKGRTVVILEDIVDTGVTLGSLAAAMEKKNVGKLKVATCLFKPDAYRGEGKPDYIAFEIENKFVVGYGMDYAGEGRNLPAIHVLA